MVETVITNPDEGKPTDDQVDLTDDASKASIKAAEDGGVVVNGEVLEPKGEPAAGDNDPKSRPDNVPEKFWDAEKGEVNTDALLKSQSDLEKKFLGEDKTDDDADADADADADDKSKDDATPDQAATIEEAEAEWAETGELSIETYKSLEKAGYSPAIVDRYIAGQVAMADAVTAKAHAITEGPENYEKMAEWADENLTDEEIQSFDVQVQNTETQEYAIQQMYAKYKAEADVEPDLIGGDTNTVTTGDFFKNSSEMVKAINSNEYKSDPTYQKQVEQMIANSDKRGVRLFG
jgi:Phage T7 capsid assembly protein